MLPSPSNLDLPVGAGVTADATRTTGRGSDFLTLAKPRLNFLVVITTVVAYYLGVAPDAPMGVLVHTIVGTALVAGGASALNQVWERHTDALMRRTRLRPVPDQRIGPRTALAFGLMLSGVGLVELTLGANVRTGTVALMTLLSYIIFYTPLKTRTSLSTVIGAVPGALPAVIGWAAATNTLSIEAWTLFAIVFLWQMPHFLAIAWLYRDDYSAAGILLLPVIQPDGRSTGRQAVLYASALVPVSLLPTLVGLAGTGYLVGALVLSAVILWLSVRFAVTRTMVTARRLFLATIIYLPVLWGILLWNHFAR